MVEVEIKTRMKNRSLDAAVDRLLAMKKEGNEWHLGVSSDRIVMIEGEESEGMTEEKAIIIGHFLRDMLLDRGYDNRVMVIRTNNGYHIISNAVLSKDEWKEVYNEIVETAKVAKEDFPIDIKHAELSLKYDNTTLRISPKIEDERYEVVKVI